MFTKRDATPEETERQIGIYESIYPDVDYRAKHSECVSDGLRDETCSCGHVLPAFIHFVRCNNEGCPMKPPEGKTLLDMIFPEGDKDA